MEEMSRTGAESEQTKQQKGWKTGDTVDVWGRCRKRRIKYSIVRLSAIKCKRSFSLEHTSSVVIFLGKCCEVNRLTLANNLSASATLSELQLVTQPLLTPARIYPHIYPSNTHKHTQTNRLLNTLITL